MQAGQRIAQPHDASPVQDVRIDTGNLRGHVGAQAQGSATALIDQLEGAQIQVTSAAGKQGVDVLDQGGNDQFVAVALIQVHQAPPEAFDATRFDGQDVGNVFGQEPACHGVYQGGWFGGSAAYLAPLEFFMYLKNSDDGSTIRVSVRFLKLCL